MFVLTALVWCISIYSAICSEEDEGVMYANRCESKSTRNYWLKAVLRKITCKILAVELENRLQETGKTSDVLEIGYSVDDVKPKKRKKYEKSELRLLESLDGVCEKILEYNIHKERKDSTRFAKGMSQTFQTLHGLVDKGVKVDLGIPYELWDKPSVEITNMKTRCETLLEDYESDIEDWYYNYQDQKSLKTFLCSEKALKGFDDSCLQEDLTSQKGDTASISDKSDDQNVKTEL